MLSGPPRIEDLERRLCTDRALDIFTMLPKVRHSPCDSELTA